MGEVIIIAFQVNKENCQQRADSIGLNNQSQLYCFHLIQAALKGVLIDNLTFMKLIAHFYHLDKVDPRAMLQCYE